MIITHSIIDKTLVYPINNPYTLCEIAFFDIETTGFSANTSYLYLIGCMYYKEHNWHLTQWLAENFNDEKELISSFTNTISKCKRLVHFNGSGFDIPYLLRKCKTLGLINPFLHVESYDIYKEILPYKRLFPLENLKLKTIETFVHFQRKDNYSGGDLINVYTSFVGKLQIEKLYEKRSRNQDLLSQVENKHISSKPSSKELEQILLLHNKEDIESLLDISSLFHYIDLFNNVPLKSSIMQSCSIIQDNIQLEVTLPYPLTQSISWAVTLNSLYKKKKTSSPNPFYNLSIKIFLVDNKLSMEVPIYKGELKYFYPNYKDYYYLPLEDTAIHKSVAEYVDKEYRVNAKPANCYNKKTSVFLPLLTNHVTDESAEAVNTNHHNQFYFEYGETLYFYEYNETLFNNKDKLLSYIHEILYYAWNSKEIVVERN